MGIFGSSLIYVDGTLANGITLSGAGVSVDISNQVAAINFPAPSISNFDITVEKSQSLIFTGDGVSLSELPTIASFSESGIFYGAMPNNTAVGAAPPSYPGYVFLVIGSQGITGSSLSLYYSGQSQPNTFSGNTDQLSVFWGVCSQAYEFIGPSCTFNNSVPALGISSFFTGVKNPLDGDFHISNATIVSNTLTGLNKFTTTIENSQTDGIGLVAFSFCDADNQAFNYNTFSPSLTLQSKYSYPRTDNPVSNLYLFSFQPNGENLPVTIENIGSFTDPVAKFLGVVLQNALPTALVTIP